MGKLQLHFIAWVVLLAGAAGVLSIWDTESALGIGALCAVLFLALILISRGFSAYSPHTSPAEFFGASSMMGSRTTLQSLGSSWIMLGNVVVAGMLLGQAFGAISIWVVLTWTYAFVLMSRRVLLIRSVLGSEDTLHTFLHRAYGSLTMQRVAATITIFVGIGVYCTELIAGMALLIAVLPAAQASLAAPLLVILLVIAMSVSAIAGGLRSVITTDSMLWPIVIGGSVLLLLFAGAAFDNNASAQGAFKWVPAGLDPWGIVAFFVGVAALQVPLLLGDFGTWQRIKATQIAEKESLVVETLKQAAWQTFLWGIPILAGILVFGLPKIYEVQSGNLYVSSAPLIETVRHWIRSDAVPLFVRVGLLTVFIIGMLAVMVSTANSYLLIAMETWVRDLFPGGGTDEGAQSHVIGRGYVRTARVLCVFIALAACLPIALLVQMNINLLGIIIIVFSVQVALAPAAMFALYEPDLARKRSRTVVFSTLVGFLAAIAFGIYTSYGVTGWWKDYGTFLTAAVALGVPTIAILAVLVVGPAGLRNATLFLRKLLWAWG